MQRLLDWKTVSQSLMNGIAALVLYLVLILAPLAWATAYSSATGQGFLHELGKGLALVGFSILALQFVLSARVKPVERPFGLDILFRFHKSMGAVVLALLLLHPLLLAAGDAGWSLLYSFSVPWHIWAGKGALLLLLSQAVLSLWRKSVDMEFQRWRAVHNILAMSILLLAFLHSWNVGQDLNSRFLQWWWILLPGVAAAFYLRHRWARPAPEQRYRISRVIEETEGVTTLQMRPLQETRPYEYNPGQFHFITLERREDLPVEEHHFTISSSPANSEYISSTIKASGDFTSTIRKTRQGDEAILQGPFGRFSYAFHPEEKDLVFVAAGIGITPYMSMLRYMRDEDRRDMRVTLLYQNRHEKDIVFGDELAEIAESQDGPQLKIVHILSRPDEGWEGKRGHIDSDRIQEMSEADPRKAVYYLCCPAPLTESLAEGLVGRGVHPDQIRTERFSL